MDSFSNLSVLIFFESGRRYFIFSGKPSGGKIFGGIIYLDAGAEM